MPNSICTQCCTTYVVLHACSMSHCMWHTFGQYLTVNYRKKEMAVWTCRFTKPETQSDGEQ